MTKAIIYRLKNGLIKGFSISGHAGAKKSGEYDLVCAAISAVGYTALGALDELCGVGGYQESDGNLEIFLPDELAKDLSEKAEIILETLEIGLKQIEAQYAKHICVMNKEV